MTFLARVSRVVAGIVASAVTFAQSIGATLGTTTAVTSWAVSSAMLAGGAVIVGVIMIGGVAYHVYTRRNIRPVQAQNHPQNHPQNPDPQVNVLVNNLNPQEDQPAQNAPQFGIVQVQNLQQIEQVVLLQPIDLQQIGINLTWEPINMTLEEYNDLEVFTMEEFNQEMSEFICHAGTRQVMRKPCLMRCCKNSQREHIWAEKDLLTLVIRNRGRCLLCQSQADESFIQFNRPKAAAILGYRHMLVKVYRQATAQDKPIWKQLIDTKFGLGYTDGHLENFQFAQPVVNQVSNVFLANSDIINDISTTFRSEMSDQSDFLAF